MVQLLTSLYANSQATHLPEIQLRISCSGMYILGVETQLRIHPLEGAALKPEPELLSRKQKKFQHMTGQSEGYGTRTTHRSSQSDLSYEVNLILTVVLSLICYTLHIYICSCIISFTCACILWAVYLETNNGKLHNKFH